MPHQAPGWRMHRLPDGGLEWTTPTGDRATTHPPVYGTDDPPGNDPPPRATPPLTLRESILGRPDPAGCAKDPPPF